MILDVTGVELMPGNGGQDCPGNGRSCDERGNLIEPCCDECDYMMCCFSPMLTLPASNVWMRFARGRSGAPVATWNSRGYLL